MAPRVSATATSPSSRHAPCVPDERSPAALLLRFHALSRAVLLERGEDALDPYALGIPFVLPTRTGEEALPEGLLERFNGSFEEFARYFHAALDRVALLRWKGALRLERARLDERRERLLADSARIQRGRARGRGHAEPARPRGPDRARPGPARRAPLGEARRPRAEDARRARARRPRRAHGRARKARGDARSPRSRAVPGELAPDFAAPSSRGNVALASLRGRWVVLYFYPVDDTPGCTLEACRFRDHRALVEQAGAIVLGVSTQDAGSHRAFASKHALEFELVADPDGRIARAYGVYDEKRRWADRVTFLIDPSGRIARIFKVESMIMRRKCLRRSGPGRHW